MSPEEEQLMIVTSALKKSLDKFASLNSSYIALEAKLSESEQRVKALEEALTPSAEIKAAFMGEFSIHFEYIDRDGEEIFYEEMIMEIMKAIRQRAEDACQKK